LWRPPAQLVNEQWKIIYSSGQRHNGRKYTVVPCQTVRAYISGTTLSPFGAINLGGRCSKFSRFFLSLMCYRLTKLRGNLHTMFAVIPIQFTDRHAQSPPLWRTAAEESVSLHCSGREIIWNDMVVTVAVKERHGRRRSERFFHTILQSFSCCCCSGDRYAMQPLAVTARSSLVAGMVLHPPARQQALHPAPALPLHLIISGAAAAAAAGCRRLVSDAAGGGKWRVTQRAVSMQLD